MAQLSEERIARDRAMIENPDNWPQWPVLPLVATTGTFSDNEHCAFMLDDGKATPRVYIGLMYDASRADQLKTRQFGSIDELLQAYRVD